MKKSSWSIITFNVIVIRQKQMSLEAPLFVKTNCLAVCGQYMEVYGSDVAVVSRCEVSH